MFNTSLRICCNWIIYVPAVMQIWDITRKGVNSVINLGRRTVANRIQNTEQSEFHFLTQELLCCDWEEAVCNKGTSGENIWSPPRMICACGLSIKSLKGQMHEQEDLTPSCVHQQWVCTCCRRPLPSGSSSHERNTESCCYVTITLLRCQVPADRYKPNHPGQREL